MLDTLWNIGSFIVAIGVLVAFHEFGHFWVARRLGIRVLKFSVGFGRPLWRRKAADGVEYIVASIPLGGYVKMLDEREGEVAAADRPYAFNVQPVWKRILVFAAGPSFNFLLAIAFYWALYVTGVPGMKPVIAEPAAGSIAAAAGLHGGDQITRLGETPIQTWSVLRSELLDRALGHGTAAVAVKGRDGNERSATLDMSKVRVDPELLFEDLGLQAYEPPIQPVLGDLVPGEAADQAGFKPGDRILSLDGEAISSFQELRKHVNAKPGQILKARIQRGDEQLELTAIVGMHSEGGKTIGRLGVGPRRVAADEVLWQDLRAELRLSPLAAVPAALNQTLQFSGLTLRLLYRMLLGEVSVKNVSGPIQIAQAAGYSASAGITAFLGFVAAISVSIGIFNLLPIPILDGGQILFGLIEAVKGSPLSERVQIAGQQIGLVLLALLMGLAFYNDIMRQIG
ncbi:MAG: sigma E protease regulator RseP [Nevskia sp.]